MSEYSDYIQDVMLTAYVASWVRPMVRELAEVLFENDVLVDRVWFSVSRAEYVEIRAVCIDENDEEVECVARWEQYDAIATPTGYPWELVSVELLEEVLL